MSNFKKAGIVLGVWLLVIMLVFIPHEQVLISEVRNVKKEDQLAFTSMPPKKSPRVIFLGNCILQSSNEALYLNKLKQQMGINFEIGNFAQQGATGGDQLVSYNYIKRFHPDLLIVHLHSSTFGYAYPFYKHDARKLIFTAGMSGLWNPLIFSTYTRNELADSVLYSFFPFIRTLPKYRYAMKKGLADFFAHWNKLPIMEFFPYELTPGEAYLNVTKKAINTFEFPMAQLVMKFFVDQLEADHQKTVFIIQETNSFSLPIFDQMPAYFEGKKFCFLYDFRKFYQSGDFIDDIHPNKEDGAIKAAVRLLQVIQKHLGQP